MGRVQSEKYWASCSQLQRHCFLSLNVFECLWHTYKAVLHSSLVCRMDPLLYMNKFEVGSLGPALPGGNLYLCPFRTYVLLSDSSKR